MITANPNKTDVLQKSETIRYENTIFTFFTNFGLCDAGFRVEPSEKNIWYDFVVYVTSKFEALIIFRSKRRTCRLYSNSSNAKSR